MCLCCPFVECMCITYEILLPSCLLFGTIRASRIRDLRENVEKLTNELKKLTEQRDDVLGRVLNEEEQEMQRLNIVKGWFKRVEGEENQIGELLRDSRQKLDDLCVEDYCSKDLRSSYKYGRKVAKKIDAVAMLKEEGKFEKVTEKVPKAAPAVDGKPTELASHHINNGET